MTTYKVEEEVFDTYEEAVEYCYEQEIIYYHTAMEYLMETDASLTESMELAYEMGLEAKDISSEVLATLIYQRELVDLITEHEED